MDILAGMIFKKDNNNVLIPRASVAEIVNTPEYIEDRIYETIKILNWYNLEVPILALEDTDIHSRTHVAILNRYKSEQQLSFFGIEIVGLPSIKIIKRKNLGFLKESEEKFYLCEVNFKEKNYHIPSLDAIYEYIISELQESNYF